MRPATVLTPALSRGAGLKPPQPGSFLQQYNALRGRGPPRSQRSVPYQHDKRQFSTNNNNNNKTNAKDSMVDDASAHVSPEQPKPPTTTTSSQQPPQSGDSMNSIPTSTIASFFQHAKMNPQMIKLQSFFNSVIVNSQNHYKDAVQPQYQYYKQRALNTAHDLQQKLPKMTSTTTETTANDINPITAALNYIKPPENTPSQASLIIAQIQDAIKTYGITALGVTGLLGLLVYSQQLKERVVIEEQRSDAWLENLKRYNFDQILQAQQQAEQQIKFFRKITMEQARNEVQQALNNMITLNDLDREDIDLKKTNLDLFGFEMWDQAAVHAYLEEQRELREDGEKEALSIQRKLEILSYVERRDKEMQFFIDLRQKILAEKDSLDSDYSGLDYDRIKKEREQLSEQYNTQLIEISNTILELLMLNSADEKYFKQLIQHDKRRWRENRRKQLLRRGLTLTEANLQEDIEVKEFERKLHQAFTDQRSREHAKFLLEERARRESHQNRFVRRIEEKRERRATVRAAQNPEMTAAAIFAAGGVDGTNPRAIVLRSQQKMAEWRRKQAEDKKKRAMVYEEYGITSYVPETDVLMKWKQKDNVPSRYDDVTDQMLKHPDWRDPENEGFDPEEPMNQQILDDHISRKYLLYPADHPLAAQQFKDEEPELLDALMEYGEYPEELLTPEEKIYQTMRREEIRQTLEKFQPSVAHEKRMQRREVLDVMLYLGLAKDEEHARALFAQMGGRSGYDSWADQRTDERVVLDYLTAPNQNFRFRDDRFRSRVIDAILRFNWTVEYPDPTDAKAIEDWKFKEQERKEHLEKLWNSGFDRLPGDIDPNTGLTRNDEWKIIEERLNAMQKERQTRIESFSNNFEKAQKAYDLLLLRPHIEQQFTAELEAINLEYEMAAVDWNVKHGYDLFLISEQFQKTQDSLARSGQVDDQQMLMMTISDETSYRDTLLREKRVTDARDAFFEQVVTPFREKLRQKVLSQQEGAEEMLKKILREEYRYEQEHSALPWIVLTKQQKERKINPLLQSDAVEKVNEVIVDYANSRETLRLHRFAYHQTMLTKLRKNPALADPRVMAYHEQVIHDINDPQLLEFEGLMRDQIREQMMKSYQSFGMDNTTVKTRPPEVVEKEEQYIEEEVSPVLTELTSQRYGLRLLARDAARMYDIEEEVKRIKHKHSLDVTPAQVIDAKQDRDRYQRENFDRDHYAQAWAQEDDREREDTDLFHQLLLSLYHQDPENKLKYPLSFFTFDVEADPILPGELDLDVEETKIKNSQDLAQRDKMDEIWTYVDQLEDVKRQFHIYCRYRDVYRDYQVAEHRNKRLKQEIDLRTKLETRRIHREEVRELQYYIQSRRNERRDMVLSLVGLENDIDAKLMYEKLCRSIPKEFLKLTELQRALRIREELLKTASAAPETRPIESLMEKTLLAKEDREIEEAFQHSAMQYFPPIHYNPITKRLVHKPVIAPHIPIEEYYTEDFVQPQVEAQEKAQKIVDQKKEFEDTFLAKPSEEYGPSTDELMQSVTWKAKLKDVASDKESPTVQRAQAKDTIVAQTQEELEIKRAILKQFPKFDVNSWSPADMTSEELERRILAHQQELEEEKRREELGITHAVQEYEQSKQERPQLDPDLQELFNPDPYDYGPVGRWMKSLTETPVAQLLGFGALFSGGVIPMWAQEMFTDPTVKNPELLLETDTDKDSDNFDLDLLVANPFNEDIDALATFRQDYEKDLHHHQLISPRGEVYYYDDDDVETGLLDDYNHIDPEEQQSRFEYLQKRRALRLQENFYRHGGYSERYATAKRNQLQAHVKARLAKRDQRIRELERERDRQRLDIALKNAIEQHQGLDEISDPDDMGATLSRITSVATGVAITSPEVARELPSPIMPEDIPEILTQKLPADYYHQNTTSYNLVGGQLHSHGQVLDLTTQPNSRGSLRLGDYSTDEYSTDYTDSDVDSDNNTIRRQMAEKFSDIEERQIDYYTQLADNTRRIAKQRKALSKKQQEKSSYAFIEQHFQSSQHSKKTAIIPAPHTASIIEDLYPELYESIVSPIGANDQPTSPLYSSSASNPFAKPLPITELSDYPISRQSIISKDQATFSESAKHAQNLIDQLKVEIPSLEELDINAPTQDIADAIDEISHYVLVSEEQEKVSQSLKSKKSQKLPIPDGNAPIGSANPFKMKTLKQVTPIDRAQQVRALLKQELSKRREEAEAAVMSLRSSRDLQLHTNLIFGIDDFDTSSEVDNSTPLALLDNGKTSFEDLASQANAPFRYDVDEYREVQRLLQPPTQEEVSLWENPAAFQQYIQRQTQAQFKLTQLQEQELFEKAMADVRRARKSSEAFAAEQSDYKMTSVENIPDSDSDVIDLYTPGGQSIIDQQRKHLDELARKRFDVPRSASEGIAKTKLADVIQVTGPSGTVYTTTASIHQANQSTSPFSALLQKEQPQITANFTERQLQHEQHKFTSSLRHEHGFDESDEISDLTTNSWTLPSLYGHLQNFNPFSTKDLSNQLIPPIPHDITDNDTDFSPQRDINIDIDPDLMQAIAPHRKSKTENATGAMVKIKRTMSSNDHSKDIQRARGMVVPEPQSRSKVPLFKRLEQEKAFYEQQQELEMVEERQKQLERQKMLDDEEFQKIRYRLRYLTSHPNARNTSSSIDDSIDYNMELSPQQLSLLSHNERQLLSMMKRQQRIQDLSNSELPSEYLSLQYRIPSYIDTSTLSHAEFAVLARQYSGDETLNEDTFSSIHSLQEAEDGTISRTSVPSLEKGYVQWDIEHQHHLQTSLLELDTTFNQKLEELQTRHKWETSMVANDFALSETDSEEYQEAVAKGDHQKIAETVAKKRFISEYGLAAYEKTQLTAAERDELQQKRQKQLNKVKLRQFEESKELVELYNDRRKEIVQHYQNISEEIAEINEKFGFDQLAQREVPIHKRIEFVASQEAFKQIRARRLEILRALTARYNMGEIPLDYLRRCIDALDNGRQIPAVDEAELEMVRVRLLAIYSPSFEDRLFFKQLEEKVEEAKAKAQQKKETPAQPENERFKFSQHMLDKPTTEVEDVNDIINQTVTTPVEALHLLQNWREDLEHRRTIRKNRRAELKDVKAKNLKKSTPKKSKTGEEVTSEEYVFENSLLASEFNLSLEEVEQARFTDYQEIERVLSSSLPQMIEGQSPRDFLMTVKITPELIEAFPTLASQLHTLSTTESKDKKLKQVLDQSTQLVQQFLTQADENTNAAIAQLLDSGDDETISKGLISPEFVQKLNDVQSQLKNAIDRIPRKEIHQLSLETIKQQKDQEEQEYISNIISNTPVIDRYENIPDNDLRLSLNELKFYQFTVDEVSSILYEEVVKDAEESGKEMLLQYCPELVEKYAFLQDSFNIEKTTEEIINEHYPGILNSTGNKSAVSDEEKAQLEIDNKNVPDFIHQQRALEKRIQANSRKYQQVLTPKELISIQIQLLEEQGVYVDLSTFIDHEYDVYDQLGVDVVVAEAVIKNEREMRQKDPYLNMQFERYQNKLINKQRQHLVTAPTLLTSVTTGSPDARKDQQLSLSLKDPHERTQAELAQTAGIPIIALMTEKEKKRILDKANEYEVFLDLQRQQERVELTRAIQLDYEQEVYDAKLEIINERRRLLYQKQQREKEKLLQLHVKQQEKITRLRDLEKQTIEKSTVLKERYSVLENTRRQLQNQNRQEQLEKIRVLEAAFEREKAKVHEYRKRKTAKYFRELGTSQFAMDWIFENTADFDALFDAVDEQIAILPYVTQRMLFPAEEFEESIGQDYRQYNWTAEEQLLWYRLSPTGIFKDPMSDQITPKLEYYKDTPDAKIDSPEFIEFLRMQVEEIDKEPDLLTRHQLYQDLIDWYRKYGEQWTGIASYLQLTPHQAIEVHDQRQQEFFNKIKSNEYARAGRLWPFKQEETPEWLPPPLLTGEYDPNPVDISDPEILQYMDQVWKMPKISEYPREWRWHSYNPYFEDLGYFRKGRISTIDPHMPEPMSTWNPWLWTPRMAHAKKRKKNQNRLRFQTQGFPAKRNKIGPSVQRKVKTRKKMVRWARENSLNGPTLKYMDPSNISDVRRHSSDPRSSFKGQTWDPNNDKIRKWEMMNRKSVPKRSIQGWRTKRETRDFVDFETKFTVGQHSSQKLAAQVFSPLNESQTAKQFSMRNATKRLLPVRWAPDMPTSWDMQILMNDWDDYEEVPGIEQEEFLLRDSDEWYIHEEPYGGVKGSGGINPQRDKRNPTRTLSTEEDFDHLWEKSMYLMNHIEDAQQDLPATLEILEDRMKVYNRMKFYANVMFDYNQWEHDIMHKKQSLEEMEELDVRQKLIDMKSDLPDEGYSALEKDHMDTLRSVLDVHKKDFEEKSPSPEPEQLSASGSNGKWSRYSSRGFQGRWDITPGYEVMRGRGIAAYFKAPMKVLSPIIDDDEFPEIRDELKRRLADRSPIYPEEIIHHTRDDAALRYLALIPNTLRSPLLSERRPTMFQGTAPGRSRAFPWIREARHLVWVNKLKKIAYDKKAERQRENAIRSRALSDPPRNVKTDMTNLTAEDIFEVYKQLDDEERVARGEAGPKKPWDLPDSPQWTRPSIGSPESGTIQHVPYAETNFPTGRLEEAEPEKLGLLFPETTRYQLLSESYKRPVAPDSSTVVGDSLYYEDELTEDGKPKRKAVLQPKTYTRDGLFPTTVVVDEEGAHVQFIEQPWHKLKLLHKIPELKFAGQESQWVSAARRSQEKEVRDAIERVNRSRKLQKRLKEEQDFVKQAEPTQEGWLSYLNPASYFNSNERIEYLEHKEIQEALEKELMMARLESRGEEKWLKEIQAHDEDEAYYRLEMHGDDTALINEYFTALFSHKQDISTVKVLQSNPSTLFRFKDIEKGRYARRRVAHKVRAIMDSHKGRPRASGERVVDYFNWKAPPRISNPSEARVGEEHFGDLDRTTAFQTMTKISGMSDADIAKLGPPTYWRSWDEQMRDYAPVPIDEYFSWEPRRDGPIMKSHSPKRSRRKRPKFGGKWAKLQSPRSKKKNPDMKFSHLRIPRYFRDPFRQVPPSDDFNLDWIPLMSKKAIAPRVGNSHRAWFNMEEDTRDKGGIALPTSRFKLPRYRILRSSHRGHFRIPIAARAKSKQPFWMNRSLTLKNRHYYLNTTPFDDMEPVMELNITANSVARSSSGLPLGYQWTNNDRYDTVVPRKTKFRNVGGRSLIRAKGAKRNKAKSAGLLKFSKKLHYPRILPSNRHMRIEANRKVEELVNRTGGQRYLDLRQTGKARDLTMRQRYLPLFNKVDYRRNRYAQNFAKFMAPRTRKLKTTSVVKRPGRLFNQNSLRKNPRNILGFYRRIRRMRSRGKKRSPNRALQMYRIPRFLRRRRRTGRRSMLSSWAKRHHKLKVRRGYRPPSFNLESGDSLEDVVDKKIDETFHSVTRSFYDPAAAIDWSQINDEDGDLSERPLWNPEIANANQIARFRSWWFDLERRHHHLLDEDLFGWKDDRYIEGIDSPDLEEGYGLADEDQFLDYELIHTDNWKVDLYPRDQDVLNRYPRDAVGLESFENDMYYPDQVGDPGFNEPSWARTLKQPSHEFRYYHQIEKDRQDWEFLEEDDKRRLSMEGFDLRFTDFYDAILANGGTDVTSVPWGSFDDELSRRQAIFEHERDEFLLKQVQDVEQGLSKPQYSTLDDVIKDPWSYPFFTEAYTPDGIRNMFKGNLNPQRRLLMEKLDSQHKQLRDFNAKWNKVHQINVATHRLYNRGQLPASELDPQQQELKEHEKIMMSAYIRDNNWRAALASIEKDRANLLLRSGQYDIGGEIQAFISGETADYQQRADRELRDMIAFARFDPDRFDVKQGDLNDPTLTEYERATMKRRHKEPNEADDFTFVTMYQLLSGDDKREEAKVIWEGVDDADDPESVHTRRAIEDLKWRLREPEITWYFDKRIDDLLDAGFASLLTRDIDDRVVTVKEKIEFDEMRRQKANMTRLDDALGYDIEAVLEQRKNINEEQSLLTQQIAKIEAELDKLNQFRYSDNVDLYVDDDFDSDLPLEGNFIHLEKDIPGLTETWVAQNDAQIEKERQLALINTPSPPEYKPGILDRIGSFIGLGADPIIPTPKSKYADPDMSHLPPVVDHRVPSIINRKKEVKLKYKKDTSELSEDETLSQQREIERLQRMQELRDELRAKRAAMQARKAPIKFKYTHFTDAVRDLPIRESERELILQAQIQQLRDDGFNLDKTEPSSDLSAPSNSEASLSPASITPTKDPLPSQRQKEMASLQNVTSTAELKKKLDGYKDQLLSNEVVERLLRESLQLESAVKQQKDISSEIESDFTQNPTATTLRAILAQHRAARPDLFEFDTTPVYRNDPEKQREMVKEWLTEFESRIGFNMRDYKSQQALIQLFSHLKQIDLYNEFVIEMIDRPHIALKYIQNNFLSSGVIEAPLNRYRVPILREYDLVMRNFDQYDPIDKLLEDESKLDDLRRTYVQKERIEREKWKLELIEHEKYLLKLRSFRHEQLKNELEEDIELAEAPRREFLEYWRKQRYQFDKVVEYQNKRLERKQMLEIEDKKAREELDRRLAEINAKLMYPVDIGRGEFENPAHPRWDRSELDTADSMLFEHSPANVMGMERYQTPAPKKNWDDMTDAERDVLGASLSPDDESWKPWTMRDILKPLPEFTRRTRTFIQQLVERDAKAKRRYGLVPQLDPNYLDRHVHWTPSRFDMIEPDINAKGLSFYKNRVHPIARIKYLDGRARRVERVTLLSEAIDKYWGSTEESRASLAEGRKRDEEIFQSEYDKIYKKQLEMRYKQLEYQALVVEEQVKDLERLSIKLIKQQEKLSQADELLEQVRGRKEIAEAELSRITEILKEKEPQLELITRDQYRKVSKDELAAVSVDIEKPLELEFVITPAEEREIIREAKTLVDRETQFIRTQRKLDQHDEIEKEREIDLIQYKQYLDMKKLAYHSAKAPIDGPVSKLIENNPFFEDPEEIAKLKKQYNIHDDDLIDDFDVEQDRLIMKVLEYRRSLEQLQKAGKLPSSINLPPVTDDAFIEEYLLDDTELRTSPDPESLRRARRLRLRQKRYRRRIAAIERAMDRKKLDEEEQALIHAEIQRKFEQLARDGDLIGSFDDASTQANVLSALSQHDDLTALVALLNRGEQPEQLAGRQKTMIEHEKEQIRLLQRRRQRELDQIGGFANAVPIELVAYEKFGNDYFDKDRVIDYIDEEIDSFTHEMEGLLPNVENLPPEVASRLSRRRRRYIVRENISVEEYDELKAKAFLQRRLEQYQQKKREERIVSNIPDIGDNDILGDIRKERRKTPGRVIESLSADLFDQKDAFLSDHEDAAEKAPAAEAPESKSVTEMGDENWWSRFLNNPYIKFTADPRTIPIEQVIELPITASTTPEELEAMVPQPKGILDVIDTESLADTVNTMLIEIKQKYGYSRDAAVRPEDSQKFVKEIMERLHLDYDPRPYHERIADSVKVMTAGYYNDFQQYREQAKLHKIRLEQQQKLLQLNPSMPLPEAMELVASGHAPTPPSPYIYTDPVSNKTIALSEMDVKQHLMVDDLNAPYTVGEFLKQSNKQANTAAGVDIDEESFIKQLDFLTKKSGVAIPPHELRETYQTYIDEEVGLQRKAIQYQEEQASIRKSERKAAIERLREHNQYWASLDDATIDAVIDKEDKQEQELDIEAYKSAQRNARLHLARDGISERSFNPTGMYSPGVPAFDALTPEEYQENLLFHQQFRDGTLPVKTISLYGDSSSHDSDSDDELTTAISSRKRRNYFDSADSDVGASDSDE